MNRLLLALGLALVAQTASAQLATEGLIIGLPRNQVLSHIKTLAHGGIRIACRADSESRLKDICWSSTITGLTLEGHAVEELYMEFFAKRLALLQVIFADRHPEDAVPSLVKQIAAKLGEPTECPEDEYGCEWHRDGQGLLVGIVDTTTLQRADEGHSGEPGEVNAESASPRSKLGYRLTLVLAELEFDDDGIWRYENQEFDDLYPIPERRSISPADDLSMR
ncbi:MAG TPA: hypothetical protein VK466_14655 [Terriglobales bacterium]|nr:hypothetical protein [Terriglobales bacterium]